MDALLRAMGNGTAPQQQDLPFSSTDFVVGGSVATLAMGVDVYFVCMTGMFAVGLLSRRVCNLISPPGAQPLDLVQSAKAPPVQETIVPAPASAPAAPAPAEQPKGPPKKAMDTPKSSPLWRVDDAHYDLTPFFHKHPGGAMVFEQSVGQDITALFHSHHLSTAPAEILKKYVVADVPAEHVIEPLDYSFAETGFFMTLKRRIVAMNIRKPSDTDLAYKLKVTAVFTSMCLTWLGVCFLPYSYVAIAVALINCTLRMTVTGIGHEAIHGRLQNKLTWEFFDMMMLFPSASWHDEHVTQHHPHTKRQKDGEFLDPDEVLDPFRLCSNVPWMPVHVLQTPLQLVLLAASYISYIDKHLVCRKAILKGTAYLFLFHLLPFFTRDSRSEAAILTTLSVGLANLITVFCFHLSHINSPNEKHCDMVAGTDWGAHQLTCSANFLGPFHILCGVTGMLEMQIEHHLFPALSYANQLRIKPVVEATAKEFGLPYYEYSNALTGIFGHLAHLHTLSRGLKPE